MIRRYFSSSGLKGRKFLYVKEFKGEPSTSNFDLVDVELQALKDGDILTSAEFISVISTFILVFLFIFVFREKKTNYFPFP